MANTHGGTRRNDDVRALRTFRDTNKFSENHPTYYAVFSYGHHWPLFVYNKVTGVWYANTSRSRSRTTNKHQSQCHPHLTNLVPMGPESMVAYLNAMDQVEEDAERRAAETCDPDVEPSYTFTYPPVAA